MTTPIKLQIPPGIDNEDDDYTQTPKWVDCDNIRFRKNFPEKIGGWEKRTTSVTDGIPRAYKIWRDHSYNIYGGIGTEKRFYIESGKALNDITPLRSSGTLGNDPFTTTNLSAIVSVAHTTHGLAINDILIYSGATAVGGITPVGEYTVTSVTSANAYTITHSSAATSSATGGGASVTFSYYLPVGRATAVYGLGYGAGPYNDGTYGTARSSSSLSLALRTWSISQWGEDLVINPRGYGVYLWDASVGTGTRAALIAAAPLSNSVAVSPVDRHMIAFGCEAVTGDGIIDPLLIRWSTQGDYTDWTPGATDTSGSKKLQSGSEIVGSIHTRNERLIFTKDSLTSMRYTGTNFVFAFDQVGTNCGLISPNAVVNHGATTFWMSSQNFYIYDGTLRTLPSAVHKHVFNNINQVQGDKCHAGLNTAHHEVWFYYCSATSDEIDKYVIYNYGSNTWYYGSMVRTTWQDHSVLSNPTATGSDGYVYLHETGTDADGVAMVAYLESGEFEFPQTDDSGVGEYMTYLDRAIPTGTVTGSVDLYIKTRRYPFGTETTKGPYSVTSATTKVDFRARGRQWAIKWQSNDLGDAWRLGDNRFQIRPQGKR